MIPRTILKKIRQIELRTNRKLILCLALVLSGGWLGCLPVTRTLNPPDAEQVRKWAGFSESTHLTATNVASDYIEISGKFKWARAYENRKGRSLESYTIALYEPGTLFGTKRTALTNRIEQTVKTNKFASEDFKLIADIRTLPNGQKAYAFPLGFDASLFTFHRDFDLLVIWSLDSRDNYPSDERIERSAHPSDTFYELFKNVDEFLNSQ